MAKQHDPDTVLVNHRDFRIVIGLMAVAALAILPFVYRATVGEVDTMRMVIGICQSIATGTRYAGYNDDISFGYYLALEAFDPVFRADRDRLLTWLNLGNATAAILFMAPFFVIVRRYWGETVAIMAGLLLLVVPVWWNTAVYGHPMVPSMLVFWLGLLVLVGGPGGARFPSHGFAWRREAGAVALFAIAISLRMDIVLVFPLVSVILWQEGRRPWPALVRSVTQGVAALVLALLVQVATRPAPDGAGGSLGGIAESLANWHNLARMLRTAASATSIAAFAWHPLLVLLTVVCLVQLWRQRRLQPLVFIGLVVAVNFVFWMANPSPARHYIYAAPLIALAVAILLESVVRHSRPGRTLSTAVLLALSLGVVTLGTSELLLPLAQRLYPWKYGVQNHSFRVPIRSQFVNRHYSEEAFLAGARLGAEMLSLAPQARPVLVITDYPLAVGMEMALRSDSAAQTFTSGTDTLGKCYAVSTAANTFVMLDIFAVSPSVLLDREGVQASFEIMIDPRSAVKRSLQ